MFTSQTNRLCETFRALDAQGPIATPTFDRLLADTPWRFLLTEQGGRTLVSLERRIEGNIEHEPLGYIEEGLARQCRSFEVQLAHIILPDELREAGMQWNVACKASTWFLDDTVDAGKRTVHAASVHRAVQSAVASIEETLE